MLPALCALPGGGCRRLHRFLGYGHLATRVRLFAVCVVRAHARLVIRSTRVSLDCKPVFDGRRPVVAAIAQTSNKIAAPFAVDGAGACAPFVGPFVYIIPIY